MDSPVDEIEFLARSGHRVEVLHELAQRPRGRSELRDATAASSPTMGRVLSDFEERRWIASEGTDYALTPLGEFVAERFFDLRDAMAVQRKLQGIWQWLPREMEGFDVELFADAVVSRPGPAYPYEPIERLAVLIEGTDRLRGFDSIVQKSIHNETVCRAVLDGLEFEYVFSPPALAGTVAWDPEQVTAAAACENCTVLVHDDLPDGDRCGLGIVDDRVGICCHDAETGALTAVVDTDAPEAREWAVSAYERVRREARPVDPAVLEGRVPPGTGP